MIVWDEVETLGAEALSRKVDEIHETVLNLAATCGIFHGMNEALGDVAIAPRKASHAIGVIQYDLINVLVIRLCALCEQGAIVKPDDASIAVLMTALDNQGLKDRLIEKDRRWRRAMLSRSSTHPDAPSNIATLIERWERLQGKADSMRRVRHLRNKKLGHVTVGFAKENSAVLQALWTLIEYTLDVAESIYLVFTETKYRYRDVIDNHREDGRALIEALRS
jgi:hypothetical protein